MKLRALTLSNVRKFGGKTASISGIGDGITVISEANEFGKSTFFDALHALFFVKFGASSREVKTLQPRSGGAVRISAEIETDTGQFRIAKSFLSQKRASVTDLASGRIIAQDDEAEAWIAALMDNGLDGPAGLLWVRQGVTALEPAGNVGAEKTEKERLLGARRDLLSSVAGEIDLVTGGRRMDRVLERCVADLGRLATAGGKARASGPWKAEQDAVALLEAEQAELAAKCRELSGALEERRRLEGELGRWEDQGAQDARQKAVTEARDNHTAAAAHGQKSERAEADLHLMALEHGNAVEALNKILRAEETLGAAQKLAHEAGRKEEDAAKALSEAQDLEAAANRALAQATKDVAAIRSQRDTAQRALLARTAHEKMDSLTKQLERAEVQRRVLEQANGVVAGIKATKPMVEAVDRAAAELQRLRDVRDAAAVTVSVAYGGDLRVSVEGEELPEGKAQPIRARIAVDLPGIGRLTIDPGGRQKVTDEEQSLDAAQINLRHALAACAAKTVEAAHKALQARQDAEAQAKLAAGLLGTLAPDGLEILRADLARATELATQNEGGESSSPHAPENVEQLLREAEGAEQSVRADYEERRERVVEARSVLASRRTARTLAETALADAAEAAGDPSARQSRKDEAAAKAAILEGKVTTAGAAFEAMQAGAPDMITAAAELKRAESALKQADDSIRTTRGKIIEISATIRARAEDGVEEALTETTGRLEAARLREARYAAEAAALTLLQTVLENTRTEARDAYFGPIQEELGPLLAILHDDAALGFDTDRMLPDSLSRGGEEEEMDALSGGTQEQIAILTRLAFAKLFARQGRPIPIILDDALVYSDDDRIVKMFTALHRVAADQQIVVFTCRQMAFAKLGGERPIITVHAED